MANERLNYNLSTIERALGKIEGVASVLEDKYAKPLLDAIEKLESAVKEITDEK